jgi:broad specificity phosphatase PhoE
MQGNPKAAIMLCRFAVRLAQLGSFTILIHMQGVEMHLFLVRHGQSVENTKPMDGSNSNSPLTTLGEAQAAAVAAWLPEHVANYTLKALFSSPMRRAKQTAQAIASRLNVEITFDDRLREVGNADSGGTPFPLDALPDYKLGVWGSITPYDPIGDGAESWMQFRVRVARFIEDTIRVLDEDHKDDAVIVVCHGGVIEAFYEYTFRRSPVSSVIVTTNNTGVTHFEYLPRNTTPDWWLRYHNYTLHLTPDQIS